jgi:hypothetical protein
MLAPVMANYSDSPLDRLWREYGKVFENFDDLTLARWLSQTLGQLEGRVWRLSHPLIGAFRLAAQLAHDRQVWHKRLVTLPHAYSESPCCRAPLLPLITRDVLETGLTCQYCSETNVPFAEIPEPLGGRLEEWAKRYAAVHEVAHWDDAKIKRSRNYDAALEDAAKDAEVLLAECGAKIAPLFLETYPAIIWEDQDECLEVRPEDITL